ncbi:MAG TPA: hypothetical protein D7H85_03520 [Candidatus Poseidoniales archaeon]|nr:MAG TPA: hypothetical protein D7H85_03520 [Candidatus Poseidoniales archaeon]
MDEEGNSPLDAENSTWLVSMIREELDLWGPLKEVSAVRGWNRHPRILLHDLHGLFGHATLDRLGPSIELRTVVLDPRVRGQGRSHELVEQAISRWYQDALLHRLSPPLEPSSRRPLISWTRNAALAATYHRAGFSLVQPERRWSRLWLFKSTLATLPLRLQISVVLDRMLRGIFMLFQNPIRLRHQIRHIREYRLFLFNPKSSLQTPSRAHPMSEMTAVTGRQLIEIEESQLQAFVNWDATEEG